MENETTATPPRSWLDRLGLGRPELRSWALYDWANSAFATTIVAAVLPIYYLQVAAVELPDNVATAYWGYTNTVAIVLIALAAPILGAIADHLGAKKRFLAAFVVLGVTGTAGLYWVARGDWILASALFVLGNVGFAGSIVFADSLLPHVARSDELDRVSAAGWALGYLGGGLLLALNTVMLVRPDLFGLADTAEASRVAFVTVAVWWAVFTIPLLRGVPEPPRRLSPDESSAANPVRAGFGRLVETFRELRQYRDLLGFLIAFWIYSDGIQTIIRMAAVYGAEIGLDATAMIGALLVVQFVGIPFTFLFGGLAGRIGAKRGIYLALAVYGVITVFGYFMTETWHFWALAFVVGMVQGGAQSLSRSLYATMTPRAKSAEFFSFYGVLEKSSAALGPAVFGIASQLLGTGRAGILALVAFFALGALLLTRVDVERGRRTARAEDASATAVET